MTLRGLWVRHFIQWVRWFAGSVARNIDANTLSLQYFDTLKELGASPSTKFIFPMEFTNMLTPFVRMASQAASGDGRGD